MLISRRGYNWNNGDKMGGSRSGRAYNRDLMVFQRTFFLSFSFPNFTLDNVPVACVCLLHDYNCKI